MQDWIGPMVDGGAVIVVAGASAVAAWWGRGLRQGHELRTQGNEVGMLRAGIQRLEQENQEIRATYVSRRELDEKMAALKEVITLRVDALNREVLDVQKLIRDVGARMENQMRTQSEMLRFVLMDHRPKLPASLLMPDDGDGAAS